MALDLQSLLRESGAVLEGHFQLSSGLHSPSYVQCARLLEKPGNARQVGEALAGKLAGLRPTRIVAPALGGVIIGYTVAQHLGIPMIFTERKEGVMALRRGFSIAPDDRVVIVEDVVTTGKSTRETADIILKHAPSASLLAYASILNRSGSDSLFDRPFHYLQSMNLETYPKERCPLCEKGLPLDAPGSRFSR